MPVPASASSRFGAPFARFGAKTWVTASAIARWPSRGSIRPVSASSFERASAASRLIVRGGGRSPTSSHCFNRENSIRSPRSGRSSRAPMSGAQPQPSRCNVAFDVHAPSCSRQPGSPSIANSRAAIRWSAATASVSLAGGSSPKRSAQSRRRRHREARGVDEGEEFKEVEAAKLGIAEPLPDQRRVEDDVRSLRRTSDCFAAARFADLPVTARQPGPGVGRVKRWQGKRGPWPSS